MSDALERRSRAAAALRALNAAAARELVSRGVTPGLADGEKAADVSSGDTPATGLGRKGAWNAIGVGAAIAQSMGVSILAARLLADEALFAELIYINWFATTLSALALAGLPAVLMRYLPEAVGRDDRPAARGLLRGVLGAAAACLGLATLAIALTERGAAFARVGPFLWLALAAAWAHAFAQLAAQGLQGLGGFGRVSRTLVLIAPLVVGASWLAFRLGAGVAGFVAVGLAANALSALLWLRPSFARLGGIARGTPAPWRRAGRYWAFVSGIVVLDLVVWQRSELWFLKRWSSALDQANYGLAFNVSSALVRMAPAALAAVFTPALAFLEGRGDARRSQELYAQGIRAMALVSAPLALATAALGPVLLSVWGASYVAAAPLLLLLAVGQIGGNVSGIAAARLHAADRADVLLKTGLVLAVSNLALDIALIPRWGALGAACASTGAQLLALPLLFGWTRRALGARVPWERLARVLLPAAAATASAAALRSAIASPLLGALAASGLGCALLVALLRAARAWDAADRWRLAVALRKLPGAEGLVSLVTGIRPAPGLAAWGGELLSPAPPAGAPAPEVSIVIPTRNRPGFLADSLGHLDAQAGPPREIVVVDSSDNDASQRVLDAFPDVRRVRILGARDNRHAAKNAGIEVALGALICFLDDDSLVQPGWLEQLLSHYADPTVGAVGGRIIDANFARGALQGEVGRLKPNGRLTLDFTHDPGQTVAVDRLIGCNISFRTELLRRVGRYDIHYGGPNFLEETDVCVRVGRAGSRLLFDPRAVVDHVNAPRDGGMKREPLDPRVEFWSARSRAYFVLKFLPRSWAVLRYNVLAFLVQHARIAVRELGHRNARAFVLQSAGLVLGALDWLCAGRPRVPPRPPAGSA